MWGGKRARSKSGAAERERGKDAAIWCVHRQMTEGRAVAGKRFEVEAEKEQRLEKKKGN